MNQKNKDYWNSRIQEIYDATYQTKQIKNLYKKAYYQVEEEIKILYDELKDKGKLSTTQLYQYNRFIQLRKRIKTQTSNIKTNLTKEITKMLTKAYKNTFEGVNDMLGKETTWGVQNNKMVKNVLNTNWEGSNFSKRIWKNTDALSNDIEASIVRGIISGTNKDIFIEQIQKKYDVGFSKADRLVRTELMHTINTAQKNTYKTSGINKVEWYASEDERMCDVCGGMHGKKYEVDKAPVLAHCNCRCTLIPVIDDTEVRGLSSREKENFKIPKHKPPKKLEKLDDLSYNNIINTLKRYENDIINLDTENAIVITKIGEVYRCYGDMNGVYPDVDLGEKLKGAFVTHNHPKEVTEYSFSEDDLKIFEEYNLGVLRGVDYKYNYILDRHNKKRDFFDGNIDVRRITLEDYRHINICSYAQDKKIGYRRRKNGK